MRHFNTILGIGITLIVIPLLGFPATWKDFFLVVLGLWLCGIYVSMRRARDSGDQTMGHEEKNHPSKSSSTTEALSPHSSKDAVSVNTHEQAPTA